MALIKTAHVNMLEAATVTLTAGTAATGYPLYRLYDRDIGRPFVGSAAATTTVHVDQGAGGTQAVDRLLIPDGHNLAGVDLDLEHSPDNSTWTPALAGWTGVAGDINKEWASIVRRYWRFTATSPAAAPSLAELWLTATDTWTREAARPGGAQEPVHNVTVAVTATARVRFEVNGPSLAQGNFSLTRMPTAQKDQLLVLWASWAGSKPFWVCDPWGAWLYVRPVSALNLREVGAGVWDASFAYLEVPA
jgi:hypothetical protein